VVKAVVAEAEDLARIDAEIHDWFFDLADVRLDDARSELVVPFRRWSYREARIVRGDFNGVRYHADRSVVEIACNIPVTISITVGRLLVSVEQTDEVTGLARYTTWPGGADSYGGDVLPVD
jgi:hypothetical protein